MHELWLDEIDQTQATAPIIFVRDGEWAGAAVCHVLEQFPRTVRLVERLTTSPPKNLFDEVVCTHVAPDTFDLLSELERIIPARCEGGCREGFLQVALNQVLTGKRKTFGIVVGDESLEAELRIAHYDVRTFVLHRPAKKTPRSDANRLARFVFGLIEQHAQT